MWRHDEIRRGLALVGELPPQDGYGGELRLQALIAAEHARAPTAAATDWNTISRHYNDLEARTGSAIIRLNRAVAVAEVDGPEAGLILLAGLDALLHDDHRVAAVRAELAQRAGDAALARASYLRALALCTNDVKAPTLRPGWTSSAPHTASATGSKDLRHPCK